MYRPALRPPQCGHRGGPLQPRLLHVEGWVRRRWSMRLSAASHANRGLLARTRRGRRSDPDPERSGQIRPSPLLWKSVHRGTAHCRAPGRRAAASGRRVLPALQRGPHHPRRCRAATTGLDGVPHATLGRDPGPSRQHPDQRFAYEPGDNQRLSRCRRGEFSNGCCRRRIAGATQGVPTQTADARVHHGPR
jgi:hypothetical protein